MTENSANNIVTLEYPVSIWKRPSMYLGERGTQQSVGLREIVDNSVHEVMRGFASKIKIIFHKDGSYSVQDDGRGLPVDENTQKKTNGIILTMATLHSGGNFSNKVTVGKAGAGLNGVGASATNALSKRFDVQVFKGSKLHELSFQDGYAGFFDTVDDPSSKFKKDTKIRAVKDPRSAAEKKNFKTGTLIRLWYNEDRFPKDERVDIDDLVDRLKYIAYIVPGIHIEIIDETRQYEDGTDFAWNFHSENGIPELIEAISPDEVIQNTGSDSSQFTKKGIYSFYVEAPYKEVTADETGVVSEIDRVATADISFRYGSGYEKTLASFVNTIHTHLGGVHEKAFEKALLESFGERIKSVRGLLTAKDEAPIIDDYFEGMTAVVSVNIPEPQFVGQQKDKVSGPEVQKALTKALTAELSKFSSNAGNQKFLKPMFEKIVQASKNRHAAAVAKLAKRKSSQISSSAMPAKLSDCDITGEEESELIICEGDSAAGTVKKARDAAYQAVLPIRGKILNAFLATNKAMLANEESMQIAKVLGAGFGKDFDIDKIRYGKVLFAADADHDGLHICNLLFTVFHRLFLPMIEEGRVYQTVPPLYEITVGTGKNKNVIYIVDDAELNQVTKKLDKDGKKYTIDRNKGLGQMEADSFFDTVLDPEKRTLKRVTIEDVAKAQEALHLTMGENSQDRRDFIGENFQVAIDSGLVSGFEEGID